MKPGRNDPCPCGSGKKYKHCCEGKASPRPAAASSAVSAPTAAEFDPLIALYNAGRYAELESRVLVMVEQFPGSAFAWKLLGGALLMQGKEALPAFRKTAELMPDDAEAHYNLGVVLKNLGRLEEAVACYRRAITIKPDYAEVHHNMGNALKDLAQLNEAEASFRRALKINPNMADSCSSLLLVTNYNASQTPSAYLAAARRYGQIVAAKVGSRFTAWQCAPNPKRLRVGMVSGDFREHSVGHFLEGLLAHLDPAQIELYGYPTQPDEDALTARIKLHFAAWKPLFNLNDQTAAQLIHTDGIHILIDLSGHTSYNRLPMFAWKPAPVQLTWIGLPATTGVTEMDYILGDPVAIPVQDEGHFSEQVWRLPESYLCFTPPDVAVEVGALPALTSGYVTFGSFNNLAKLNDATVAVWARVLQAIPCARLYFKSKHFQNTTVFDATLKRFSLHGIKKNRLTLDGFQAVLRTAHLTAYQRVDIALDPFPYPGVTTSVEALWMGVPVITLRGDRFISHTAESIAHNAGLADWIAADDADYVAKAVFHAAHLQQLAELRVGLRQQIMASPLCDAPRFARNFEQALWGMWQAHQDKQ